MSALQLMRGTVRFGDRTHGVLALDGVDLTLPTDSVVGLVGESGSGKSTVARVMTGLVELQAGTVALDGRPLRSLRRRTRAERRRIQMVFQDPFASLNPRMPVGSAIAEALPGSSRNKTTARNGVTSLLELVGLDPSVAAQLPGNLSGGQRQRVAIGRALAAEPAYLIADEITSALDVSVQGAILNLIKNLQRQLGFGLLFISHDLAVVRYVSETVHVMFHGQIVESGPSRELFNEPVHPYSRALLDSLPGSMSATPVPSAKVAGEETGDGTEHLAGCRFRDRCPDGPTVHPGRTICDELDPQTIAHARRHMAACHFAPE
jgi:peptide/nickel transport system ATP-binding protein